MPDNRIEQTTVANKVEDERLKSINPQEPWNPTKTIALVSTVAVAVLASVGSVIASGVFSGATILGALVTGLSTGLALFFGIKSGGTQK